MGQTFTKIKYATEGAYGTTEYKYVYLCWHRTCDCYTLFDSQMKPIITFEDWLCNDEDFAPRLNELLSCMPDEEGGTNHVEYCSPEERAKLEENMRK